MSTKTGCQKERLRRCSHVHASDIRVGVRRPRAIIEKQKTRSHYFYRPFSCVSVRLPRPSSATAFESLTARFLTDADTRGCHK